MAPGGVRALRLKRGALSGDFKKSHVVPASERRQGLRATNADPRFLSHGRRLYRTCRDCRPAGQSKTADFEQGNRAADAGPIVIIATLAAIRRQKPYAPRCLHKFDYDFESEDDFGLPIDPVFSRR